MGIRVSETTIHNVWVANGLPPHGPYRGTIDQFRPNAKDAGWSLDSFAVLTARNAWVQVLIIIDIYTRERIDFRVYDGWDVDSWWTTRAFHDALVRAKRKPTQAFHDRGAFFLGQFERQLRVLDIDRLRTPTHLPIMNAYVESAIGTCRQELLRHIRCANAEELQRVMDGYRTYVNDERAHQGLEGRTPSEMSRASEVPAVLSLDELRKRRLVKRAYANGILNGYSLEPANAA